MRLEWVFFGFVLLSLGLSLKVLFDRHVIPRLALGFSMIWALLAAIHFWEPLCRLFGGGGALFGIVPIEIVCFWGCAVIAMSPGILLTKFLVRENEVALPIVVDRVLNAFVPLVVAIAVSSSVVMTGALLESSLTGLIPPYPSARRVVTFMQSMPVRVYVASAAIISGTETRTVLNDRVPPRVRATLFRNSMSME